MANDSKVPPSEIMEGAITMAGSICITCELCDRTHFASGEPDFFDPGELGELREKAAKEPEKYLEDAGSDSLSWGRIDGKQAVIGCPCNGLKRYEDFIWNNRHVISKYLEARAKDRLAQAQHDSDLAKGVKKAVSGT